MAHRFPRFRTPTVALAAALACALWSCDGDSSDEAETGETVVADANSPGAIVTLREGGFVFGERATGKVRLVDPEGRVQVDPIAHVELGDSGELLGLAVDIGERIYASWLSPDGRLLVAWVDASSEHVFWRGPAVADGDVGGQLAISPNGDLVIAIGDLGDPARSDEGGAPNGKLLALDPKAGPDQRPEIYSQTWTNPLAFTFDDEGSLWVADAPTSGPGRLVKALGKRRSTEWQLAAGAQPSGLAASGTDLVLCDSASKELDLYQDGRKPRLLANDCTGGVAREGTDSFFYSTADAIKAVTID